MDRCQVGRLRLATHLRKLPHPPTERGRLLNPSLSLVLPVRNCQGDLQRQVSRALEILPELTSRFDVLVIDLGSTDATQEVADDLVRQYPQVRFARRAVPPSLESLVSASRQLVDSDVIAVHVGAPPLDVSQLRRIWLDNFNFGRPPRIAPPEPKMRLISRLANFGPKSAQRPTTPRITGGFHIALRQDEDVGQLRTRHLFESRRGYRLRADKLGERRAFAR
jgi:glycosyltransferase involved in cell wall biosynthesis